MKKFVSLLLCALLCLSGCAAGNGGASPESVVADPNSSENAGASQEAPSAEDGLLHVGIIQLTDHPSLNTIREAFVAQLNAQMGEKVVIETDDAQNDMSNINSICQKYVGDGKDLIVAIATPAAQAAAAATSEIPVLYSAVSDPQAANLVGLPNVTGTSDAIPVESIFHLAAELTPDAKTFGLIYNTSEINSVSVIEGAKAYMQENGLQFVEATITNSSELQQSASSLVGKVDAIFTPIDNTVATAMPVLAGIANMNQLPVYVGADSMVADGGLATVGIDYSLLGTRTAEMAAEILGGKSPSEIPFEVLDDYSTILNPQTAKEIGIELSEEILASAVQLGA
ncbi:MAG: ABC transporter substrate-binding protein [Provencibacterium sp.]|jgi:putative ABC transport system substrate-binding protein|nr:ABC transporter substrate-binding protein [Provencibacterium sp.]